VAIHFAVYSSTRKEGLIKMRRINRDELLHQLESVQPGLSVREIIEQSSCFVFDEGTVMTFNGEDACRLKTKLDITGAVRAAPVMALLRQLGEQELEIEVGKNELVVTGKNRSAGISMEAQILLPIDKVEKPKGWKPLHEEFAEAIQIVQQCTGKDESKFYTTCVHVGPKWVEACDNYQITRYKLKTGFANDTLVRGTSIKHIVTLGMTHFSETQNYVHFRNSIGLVFSCRRFVEDYPDLASFLKVSGEPTVLPKGLGEAATKAEIFSSENADDNQVLVKLRSGKLMVKGTGVSGWYEERKKLKYDGPPLDFLVSPKLLVEITKRHNECEIMEDRLKVDGGKFVYVTCLGTSNDKEKEEPVEEEEEE
jgi:hypothetical protein